MAHRFTPVKGVSPRASAIATYWYVCKDLEDGITYGIAAELYNKSMEAVGSSKRTDVSVGSRQFAEDFYKAAT